MFNHHEKTLPRQDTQLNKISAAMRILSKQQTTLQEQVQS